MKYIIILPDGVSDAPLEELDGKTPLEAAKHPNMDWIAREGLTGWARTIPEGFAPGSDVGCMSVFGYDPRRYHTGRAPLEAAAQGIVLGPSQAAFRCNTLTVQEGKMVDHSADHITSEESHALVQAIAKHLEGDGIRYYPGVGYRHLALLEAEPFAKAQCTPPHDILGQAVEPYLPRGPGSELLRRHMQESVAILSAHPVNRQRLARGKRPATMTWFWGQGRATRLPPFTEAYGRRAGCISAVDIVRGLGKLAGFDIIPVPGITGYFDTNYKGKADYALKALDDHDLVLVHIESTDEAGHMGDARKKIQAIEDTDRLVVGTLLEGLKRRNEPFAVLVTPDHPTRTALKTHTADPVPFALYATDGPRNEASAYSESALKDSAKRFEEGFRLMSFFLEQGKK